MKATYLSGASGFDSNPEDFKQQELANTAWAFAKACQEGALLFAASATVAEQHMDDFNVQELANTA